MRPLIAGCVVVTLTGCGGTAGNLFGPGPEPAAPPVDSVWHHVIGGQCVPKESTPAQEAELAGGESKPTSSFEGGEPFTYPVEVVFVEGVERAIYVQGGVNCRDFVNSFVTPSDEETT